MDERPCRLRNQTAKLYNMRIIQFFPVGWGPLPHTGYVHHTANIIYIIYILRVCSMTALLNRTKKSFVSTLSRIFHKWYVYVIYSILPHKHIVVFVFLFLCSTISSNTKYATSSNHWTIILFILDDFSFCFYVRIRLPVYARRGAETLIDGAKKSYFLCIEEFFDIFHINYEV